MMLICAGCDLMFEYVYKQPERNINRPPHWKKNATSWNEYNWGW